MQRLHDSCEYPAPPPSLIPACEYPVPPPSLTPALPPFPDTPLHDKRFTSLQHIPLLHSGTSLNHPRPAPLPLPTPTSARTPTSFIRRTAAHDYDQNDGADKDGDGGRDNCKRPRTCVSFFVRGAERVAAIVLRTAGHRKSRLVNDDDEESSPSTTRTSRNQTGV